MSPSARNLVVLAGETGARWRAILDRFRRASGLPASAELVLLTDSPSGALPPPIPGFRVWTIAPGASPASEPGGTQGSDDRASQIRKGAHDVLTALRSEGALRPIRLVAAVDGSDRGSLETVDSFLENASRIAFENGLECTSGLVVTLPPEPEAVPPPGLLELFERLESEAGGIQGIGRRIESVVLLPEGDDSEVVLSLVGLLHETLPENEGSTLGRPHLYRTARTARIGLDLAPLHERGASRLAGMVREKLLAPGPDRSPDNWLGAAAALATRLELMRAIVPAGMTVAEIVARQPADPVRTEIPSHPAADSDFIFKKLKLDFEVAKGAVDSLADRVGPLADEFLEKAGGESAGAHFADRLVHALLNGALRGEWPAGDLSPLARGLRAWASEQFAETLLLELSDRATQLESQKQNQFTAFWALSEKVAMGGGGAGASVAQQGELGRSLARLRSLMNDEIRTLRALVAVRYSHEVLGRISKGAREADKRLAAIREAVAGFPAPPPPWLDDSPQGDTLPPEEALLDQLERALHSVLRTILDANRRATSPGSRQGDRETILSPIPLFLDFPKAGPDEILAQIRKAAEQALGPVLQDESLLVRHPEAQLRWRRSRETPFRIGFDRDRAVSREPGLAESPPPIVMASPKIVATLTAWSDGELSRNLPIGVPTAAWRIDWSEPLPLGAFTLFASRLGESPILPISLVERFRARIAKIAWQSDDPSRLFGLLAALDRIEGHAAAGRPLEASLEADALLPALDSLPEPDADPVSGMRFLIRLAAAPDLDTIAGALADAQQVAAALPPCEERLSPLLSALAGEAGPLGRLLQTTDPVERIRQGEPVARHLASLLETANRELVGGTRFWLRDLLARIGSRLDDDRSQHVGRVELELVLEARLIRAAGEIPVLLRLENRGRYAARDVVVELRESPKFRISGEPRRSIPSLAAGDRVPLRFPIVAAGAGELPIEIRWEGQDLAGRAVSGLLREPLQLVEAPATFARVDANPYVAGPPVKAREMFFGREEIFSFIRENLRGQIQDNILILHGWRRTGKSSILYRLAAEPERLVPGYRPVLFDIEGLGRFDTATFLATLARRIARELPAGIDPPAVDRARFPADPYRAFDDFLDGLESRPIGGKFLVMLDEFDLIEEKVKEGLVARELFAYLRSLMQHRGGLAFLLAGTGRLLEMRADYWSALFSLAQYRRVSFLSPEETRRLVREPLAGQVAWDDLAVDQIVRLTAGHPYYVQILCHALVARMNEAGRSNFLSTADVTAVEGEILDLAAGQFRFDLGRASDGTARRLLGALASVDADGVERTPVDRLRSRIEAAGGAIADDLLDRAVASLVDADLVESDRGRSALRFRIDLLRLWLRTSLGALALEEGGS